jgi:hypothetical protein
MRNGLMVEIEVPNEKWSARCQPKTININESFEPYNGSRTDMNWCPFRDVDPENSSAD